MLCLVSWQKFNKQKANGNLSRISTEKTGTGRGIRNKTFLKLWPNPFLQDGVPLSRSIKNVYFPCQVYDFNGWTR